MPDYIYLLENRLTADQQHAVRVLREVAHEAGTILFLTGGAVRDLTNGYAVRELEVAIHGNALKLKKVIEKRGAVVWGEEEASKTLSLCFPGTVRVDLVSTHRIEYPTSGKPVYHKASIQEYLRGRDFTANAMGLSLNEGSYGLLMDPLNGVADIESRTLRLVSAYGFIEEPAFLIRATRYRTRLGWELDAKSQTRFENALEEGVIGNLSPLARGLELEQIAHEEDGLKILQAFEAAGWMKVLFPAWTAAKADEARLTVLHDLAVRFELQGVHADLSAARMQLLTAKLTPKDRQALQKLLPRPGFVAEWNSLDTIAAGFAKALQAKDKQKPSASYKLFMSYDPEAILWLGFTTKLAGIRDHFEKFLTEWPEARQRIPHALLQEMRIVPDLPVYKEVLDSLFLAFIDGKLTTPEELRAFLEPYSPPAPPPPVTIKRTRVKRGAGARVKDDGIDDEDVVVVRDEDDLDDLGAEDDLDLDLNLPMPVGGIEEDDELDLDDELGDEPAPVRGDAKTKSSKPTPIQAKSDKAEKPVKSKSAAPADEPAVVSKVAAASAKAQPVKATAKTVAPVKKPTDKKPVVPVKKVAPVVKVAAKKVAVKTVAAPAKGKAVAAKAAPKKLVVAAKATKPTVVKSPVKKPTAKPVVKKKLIVKKPVAKPVKKLIVKKPAPAPKKTKPVAKKVLVKKVIAKKPTPKPAGKKTHAKPGKRR